MLVEPVEGEDSCHIELDRVQGTDEVFIATVQPVSWDKTESGEQSIGSRQRADLELKIIIDYQVYYLVMKKRQEKFC